MSLYIDSERITAVLLADGWHVVKDGSFFLDAYEFHDGGTVLLYGGRCDYVPATGFAFTEPGGDGDDVAVYGPLTSVLAVRSEKNGSTDG